MLIKYKCFNCKTEQQEEDPFVKSQNFMQWYFKCRCPNCNYANIEMRFKPIQMQIQFPPFKLN